MRRGEWGGALVLTALWLPLLARLAPGWNADPELKHGWAVPLLAVYLAWERRDDSPPAAGLGRPASGGWMMAGFGALALAALLPVLEANPFWPAALWLATAAAALATAGVVAARAGWRVAAHYAFPVAFLFTALPWPAMVQTPLTLGLATVNAEVAAELVSYAGHPAVVHGRVIEVATGLVGIDEACSGMRSLQTVTMVGLFFGELFRLRVRRRVSLLAAALATAVAGNLARTFFLTWLAATRGIAAMELKHDAAGEAALVGTLVAVALLGWLWARGAEPVVKPVPADKQEAPVARSRAAAGMAVALIALMATAEIGTRLWYARGDASEARVRWGLAKPEGWVPAEVPSAARALLAYTHGEGRSADEPARGLRWLAFVFNWTGDPKGGGAIFLHDPTICLPSIGSKLEATPGPVAIDVGGVAVRFETYRFRAGERTQHVFFCLWDGYAGRALDASAGHEDIRAMRLRQVREGRRGLDLYQLIFVVEGEVGDAEAVAALRRVAPELLRRVH